MVMAGKTMWKEMVNPNWIRARSSALIPILPSWALTVRESYQTGESASARGAVVRRVDGSCAQVIGYAVHAGVPAGWVTGVGGRLMRGLRFASRLPGSIGVP